MALEQPLATAHPRPLNNEQLKVNYFACHTQTVGIVQYMMVYIPTITVGYALCPPTVNILRKTWSVAMHSPV